MKRFSKFLIIVYLPFLLGCNNMNDLTKEAEGPLLFDFGWKFNLGDIPDASNMNYDDSDWRSLQVPHDWSIEEKIDSENSSGNDGGYYPTGIGWYRKNFEVPATWTDKDISIYFEGVYMNSEVFINGVSMGIRPYGYSSFYYDLTPHLIPGANNVLAVRVDNSQQKNSRWYSGSGIYRHVWISVNELVHISPWGVAITTQDISETKATVQVQSVISNRSESSQEIKLSTRIKDKNAVDQGQDEVTLTLAANEEKQVVQSILINDPHLWAPESPDLYEVEISIIQDEKPIEVSKESFGLRSIEFSAENGFLLNGKKVLLNGGNLHHDNGSLGAKAYDRAEERKVELLKEAGFNAVRTAHNPPSEAFLDACDRIGLLVIDESFDGWKVSKTPHDYCNYFEEWAVRDMQDLVLRDMNHPSIIMWSIGNEVLERKEPEAVRIAKMLRDVVRAIDTTRPVTSAMTTWDEDWEIFDPLMAEHDVAGYNYQLHRAPADHQRVPYRIIVNTESFPRNAFNIWKLVSENSYILGDFVWTAIDYLGESGIGGYYYPNEEADEHWKSKRFPWHGAYCGDIDFLGWRKPISHYRSMLYNQNEKLYMAVREPNPEGGEIKLTSWAVWPTWERWTWPDFEGKDIEVEVYSKFPSVRLYLNDELIGEKQTGIATEFKATFTLPYSAGKLKAVGIENDNEMDTVVLQTAAEASKIELTADRTKIVASGQDLSYVIIEVKDQNGVIQPMYNELLKFNIEGPGVIEAVDNGNLKDLGYYVANERKTWNGRAMAIVRSTREKGTIKLKVSAKNLSATELTIQSN